METYLFYLTHLIMAACAVVVISTALHENIRTAISRMLIKLSDISPMDNLKTIYRLLTKERQVVKALIVSILNIGMQITNLLMK